MSPVPPRTPTCPPHPLSHPIPRPATVDQRTLRALMVPRGGWAVVVASQQKVEVVQTKHTPSLVVSLLFCMFLFHLLITLLHFSICTLRLHSKMYVWLCVTSVRGFLKKLTQNTLSPVWEGLEPLTMRLYYNQKNSLVMIPYLLQNNNKLLTYFFFISIRI